MEWSWSLYKTINALILVVSWSSYLTLILHGGATYKARKAYKYHKDENGTLVYNLEYYWLLLLSFITHLIGVVMLPHRRYISSFGIVLLFISALRVLNESIELKKGNYLSLRDKEMAMGTYFDIATFIMSALYLHFVIQISFTKLSGIVFA